MQNEGAAVEQNEDGATETETETEAGSAQPLAPYGASIAINIGVYNITAFAKIEGTVTLNAGDLVSVRARASNKIDVGGLPVVNLIEPFVDAFSSATHNKTDGLIRVLEIGDTVDANGNRYRSKVQRNDVDLGAVSEDYTDSVLWEEVTFSGEKTKYYATVSEYLDDNFGFKVNGFDLWTQSYARGSTVGIALAYGHAELNYRSDAQHR